MLKAIKEITGTALPMSGDDIDTDRIIPSRFLRCVTFDGLGANAFADERFAPDGKPYDHPMNNKNYDGSKIIITNKNFGCGSSREHAPQAIKRAGFDAVIAESFAEIYYGNSSVLGLVSATLPKSDIDEIIKNVTANPKLQMKLDIINSKLFYNDKIYNITLKDAQKTALINGSYDTIAELLQNKESVKTFESNLPY